MIEDGMDARRDGLILIPAYGEAGHIGAVVSAARRYVTPVVVVDDGSPDDTSSVAAGAGAVVLAHARNLGKGAALQTGFRYAREIGAAFVLTMDGDGQHAVADIPTFLRMYGEGQFPVIIGNRMTSAKEMPWVRCCTNFIMSGVLSRRMGQRVPDTQNGFRLYRTDVIPDLAGGASGFAAESEVLMELARRGVRIGSVPVRIIYDDERSKIHPWRDTIRFFRMLRAFDRRMESGKTA